MPRLKISKSGKEKTDEQRPEAVCKRFMSRHSRLVQVQVQTLGGANAGKCRKLQTRMMNVVDADFKEV